MRPLPTALGLIVALALGGSTASPLAAAAAGDMEGAIVFDAPPASVKAGSSLKLSATLYTDDGAPAPAKTLVLVAVRNRDTGAWTWGKPLPVGKEGRFSFSAKAPVSPWDYRLLAPLVTDETTVLAQGYLPQVPVAYPVTIKLGKPDEDQHVQVTGKTPGCGNGDGDTALELQVRPPGESDFVRGAELACEGGVLTSSFWADQPGVWQVRAARFGDESTTATTYSSVVKLTVKKPVARNE